MKLSLMFEIFRKAYKAHLVPLQNVSYDEMMVAFYRRVMHTKKAPHKPIDEGFKLYGLCDSGYLIDFAFYSLVFGMSLLLTRYKILVLTLLVIQVLAR